MVLEVDSSDVSIENFYYKWYLVPFLAIFPTYTMPPMQTSMKNGDIVVMSSSVKYLTNPFTGKSILLLPYRYQIVTIKQKKKEPSLDDILAAAGKVKPGNS